MRCVPCVRLIDLFVHFLQKHSKRNDERQRTDDRKHDVRIGKRVESVRSVNVRPFRESQRVKREYEHGD